MSRTQLPESPIRARRRRRRAIYGIGAWALCMSLAVGAVALAHAPFMRIKSIAFEGSRTVAHEALQKSMREFLAGRYLGLFPRDNIFLYPKEQLAAAVMAAYPTLRGVEVGARDFTTLEVTAQDRVPRALWCGASFEVLEPCLLLDEDGVAYASAPEFSDNPYQRYFGALTAAAPLRHFLAPSAFRPLAALADALAQHAGEPAVGVAVDPEHDAYMRFENGFELRFALQSDGGDVFERFGLALESEPFKNRALADFEYLDLRFGDRLYYKLKGEPVPAAQAEE